VRVSARARSSPSSWVEAEDLVGRAKLGHDALRTMRDDEARRFFVLDVDDEDTWRRRLALVRSIEGDARGNRRVIEAMMAVPRHAFVPAPLRDRAYQDCPLPIGHGQTISQPAVVAMMTEALCVGEKDVVMEVGTGSGYQAAVVSRLVQRVETLEIVEPLADQARIRLRRIGCDNVQVHLADGYVGWASGGPYDAIIITAAPEHVPQGLIGQLRDGGRMVVPVGPQQGVQELMVLVRDGSATQARSIASVRFVPMVRSGH
jgi:protein-L-isoaspartate(D-aspartate) O-methyltransferase